MRRIITSIILLYVFIAMPAANVTFKKIWLEHNVVQFGEKGLKVHIAFDIYGMQGQLCTAIAYFDCPKGIGIKDTNGKYRTSNGNVCATTKFNPSYPNTSYSDFSVFIPNSELHLLPGKRTYYTRVFIQAPNGSFLGNSEFVSFDGTGSSESNNYANNANQANKSNSSVKKWREDLGYGMFAINEGNPNGVHTRTLWRICIACRGAVLCGSCNGTKKCLLCSGQGGITMVSGNYIPCVACNMTGQCTLCHGSGKCACAKSEFPGYMPGHITTYGMNGDIIYDSGSSSSKSSSSSSSKSSGGTCSKCGGRKYENTSYQYAAASTSGWMPPYHNSGGSSCPYCNYKTDHYHYPCTGCRGFGHN